MKSIGLESGVVRLTGALGFDRRDAGIAARRLPDWTRPQLDPLTNYMVRLGSGVRVEFDTNSPSLSLTVLTSRTQATQQAPPPCAFDLTVDGEFVTTRLSDKGNLLQVDPGGGMQVVRGDADVIRFDDLGNAGKQVAIWLPANALVEMRDLQVADEAAVSQTIRDVPRWVHYGSSISHCMEARSPCFTWPVVAARLAGVELCNLGLGGSCHLDQYVARTIRDLPVDLISLKMGINVIGGDTLKARTFLPALHGFLDTLREGKPDTPVLLVSPIYCPSTENHPGPQVNKDGVFVSVPDRDEVRGGSLTLVQVREIFKSAVEVRQAAGDVNLHYLSGLELFGEGDAADLPDNLHPNAAGYIRMGERFHELAFKNGVFAF
ncbi:MAG: SGNH/GDSL hydrolase family protein [Pseudomonadales bacterium]|nr:SGNH/GDSL hydrolase family protein [Pseudomonadales bacterium]MDP7357253.1 SGNH/GDSL hydrolase family protein [Pseudomonadales bacterium]MDP7596836.1 SGNH/GDSL hydrolase family protein [Pseudomonadales bacterium]HJN52801.1 SGNH/GDSL hydrolase family protein [Pseudomonadales bacterium]